MNSKKLKISQIDILLTSLVNKDEELAKNICNAEGYSFRITRKDELIYPIQTDFKYDRVNVIIENNLIISANIG